MTTRILRGDCRAVLPTLATGSVHCVVTSPPYFGLRSYLPEGHPDKHLEMGSEATPEEFVAALVKVFQEVRRVLRDDGTLWLNLGSSFASGGRSPTPSPEPSRVLACGTGDKAPSGLPDPGCACSGRRDAPPGGLCCHPDGKQRIGPRQPPRRRPSAPRARDTAPGGSVSGEGLTQPPDVPVSTMLSSQRSGLGDHGPEGAVLASREAPQTLHPGSVGCGHTSAGISGTPEPSRSSAAGTTGTGASVEACSCGSCGVCWAYSAIPSLRFKSKDLISIPMLVALALQADGWYLRSDIIWCLSGGAWVYARTQKGDMPVMVKDLVRLDPRTVHLWNGDKWTQVLGWGASNDTSQRLELVLRSGERIGCTGKHLWPTQRGNVAARDLVPGDVIQSCRLPDPLRPLPRYLTDRLLWLLGLYLAVGSRSDDTVQLSLHADEIGWLEAIAEAAADVGATMTHTVKGSMLSVRLHGRVLRAAIEEYVGGATAHDKHLRVPAWSLPDDALRQIARGYLDGDGHADGTRVRIGFCRNYALERDLRTLAGRLGATLTLNLCVNEFQGGKRPAFKGEWRWQRSGHWNEKDRGEVVAIRNSRARRFWDIAVEDEPHLLALASGVLTHNCKPNPMPESVRDRPTSAHEHVFLLTKKPSYFYDAVAIAEPLAQPDAADGSRIFGGKAGKRNAAHGNRTEGRAYTKAPEAGRNARSVWTIATQPFSGAHFATMAPTLAERCILAGTSERGACPSCGTPWERQVEKLLVPTAKVSRGTRPDHRDAAADANDQASNRVKDGHVPGMATQNTTTGWAPGCGCPIVHPLDRCVVLDPFGGAGTTGLVADRLQRDAVLIELNPESGDLAAERVAADAPLLAQVT